MNLSIVLVHVGNNFADYINDCIEQIKCFNECNIYMVISKQHFNKIAKDVQLVALEDLPKTKNHLQFLSSSERDANFRDGFWKSVVERFYIIEDVIISYELKHVFHFENDNMIYCNLEEILQILVKNGINCAAPFDNDERCIPSFMYFNGVEVLSNLNKFMFLYPDCNDMELIALFNKTNKSITMLPLIPSNYDIKLQSKTGKVVQNEWCYKNNYEIFNSIFDAAALGQYLGGVDARNMKFSFLKRFFSNKIKFINESAVYDVSRFNFFWKIDNKGKKTPFLKYKNSISKINNLHIHSKELNRFK